MNASSAATTPLPIGQGLIKPAQLISISDAKNALAQLVEAVLDDGRVVITRNGRQVAVLLSIADYTAMAAAIPDPLKELEQQFEGLLTAIGSDATAAASRRLHDATPAELGALAHASVMSKASHG
jgi:prevent-host-death family protein